MRNEVNTYLGSDWRCVWSDSERPLYMYRFYCSEIMGEISVFLPKRIPDKYRIYIRGLLTTDSKNRYKLTRVSILPDIKQSAWELYKNSEAFEYAVTTGIDRKHIKDALSAAYLSLFNQSPGLNPEQLAELLTQGGQPANNIPYSARKLLELCSSDELIFRAVLGSYGFPPKSIGFITAMQSKAAANSSLSANEYFGQLAAEIANNPYRLVYNYDVSFEMVDGYVMASKSMHPRDKRRKDAMLNNTLSYVENRTGNSLLTPAEVLNAVSSANATPIKNMELGDLKSSEVISEVNGAYIRNTTLDMEKSFFEYVESLSNSNYIKNCLAGSFTPPPKGQATDEQYDAIKKSTTAPVSIITGGPGCGKTFTVNTLISQIDDEDRNLLLLAPTGKAAQRMSEVTNKFACTIHYLAMRKPEDYKKGDKLTVVVDESSMLSNETASLLVDTLKHYPVKRLIFVGDINQLPAVGAGNVLQSMIDSGRYPLSTLTKVKRQGHTSSIVQVARGMLDGTPIGKLRKDILPNSKRDLFFSRYPTNGDPIKLIARALSEGNFEKYVENFDPIRDFQLLCPLKRGAYGVYGANLALQNLLNLQHGKSASARCGTANMPYQVRKGDKILCTRNEYDIGVVNGDVGFVSAVEHSFIEADIVGKGDTYIPQKYFSNVDLGYAMTIHKAQGSENPVVVSLLPPDTTPLYQRNLLYTAITRSRNLQWVIANDETLNHCIRNDVALHRNTAMELMMGNSKAGLVPLDYSNFEVSSEDAQSRTHSLVER